jgi:hypothetical protein
VGTDLLLPTKGMKGVTMNALPLWSGHIQRKVLVEVVVVIVEALA